MDLRPGSPLGDYRVVAPLGRGGMGTVYRAEHRRLGRTVALKVLRDPALSQRFLNEARIQAGLRHPHIATLYDYFECDGHACIAMELIEGETLAERLRSRGPVPFGRALGLFRPVMEAAAALHRHGVIHRDLKSHNVKVTPGGHVTLLDFGIAKELGQGGLTTGGAVPGTPEYLSPEQVLGKPPDARSDVWALGVLLYELLTGDVPFRAPSAFSLFERITEARHAPPSSRAPGVPPEADALVARCLQADPHRRFSDAGALLAALPRGAAPATSIERPAVSSQTAPRPGTPRLGGAVEGAGRDWAAYAPWLAGVLVALAVGAVVLVADGALRQPEAAPTPPEAVVPTGAMALDVRIDAVGAPAEVFRGGVRLGTTPLTLQTWAGEDVALELRRGDATAPVRFETTPGKRAYTIDL